MIKEYLKDDIYYNSLTDEFEIQQYEKIFINTNDYKLFKAKKELNESCNELKETFIKTFKLKELVSFLNKLLGGK